MSICFILLNMAVVIKKYKKGAISPSLRGGLRGLFFSPILFSPLLFSSCIARAHLLHHSIKELTLFLLLARFTSKPWTSHGDALQVTYLGVQYTSMGP